jgi:hypothetical protein
MTPALLEKIVALIKAGATVIGAPPLRSPGLSDFPRCDQRVAELAADWKGKIVPAAKDGGLYPAYELTAEILHDMGVAPDFASAGPLRYTHRTGKDWDIYFVANKMDSAFNTDVSFRVTAATPELWDAVTGATRPLQEFAVRDGRTVMPLKFEPYQSFFIVFRKGTGSGKGKNFPSSHTLMTLRGPWSVSFDTAWGGPAHVRFDSLYDWTNSKVDGIRYYSGEAHYRKTFDLALHQHGRIYLDLGTVKDMARVRLNGKDLGVVWTAPWRVEITDVARAKGNQLDITIANRWPNRLIGDERLPDDGIKDDKWPEWLLKGLPRTSGRFTFTTYKHYTKDSPLLPSGLLGPVRVVGEE